MWHYVCVYHDIYMCMYHLSTYLSRLVTYLASGTVGGCRDCDCMVWWVCLVVRMLHAAAGAGGLLAAVQRPPVGAPEVTAAVRVAH